MALPPSAVHRTIMVIDVADFTNPARTVTHQLAVHRGMYDVLHNAFAESGIEWTKCHVEDRGDGAMILIPAEVPKNLIADRLPDRLAAGLRRYNAIHSVEAAVQLRVGLHSGDVYQNANGVVSQAVNFAFRILDASAAKSALRVSPGVVAIIASDPFYRDVILQDPAANPDSYQRIPVSVKGTSTQAWLRMPGGPEPVPDVDPPKTVLDLLSSEELDRLSGWISDITVPNVLTMVRRAAGPAVAVPASDNAWDVFRELTDVNAGPDGIPPALLFLDLLTGLVDDELRAKLTDWIAAYARQLRVESALETRRKAASPVPSEPHLHLLIALEPYDADRYLLSSWRQDDPELWPPPRGNIQVVTVEELEYRVDEVVLGAEREWACKSARVTLEFLLPRQLLHLAVHHWSKEHTSGNPSPLRLDYPIMLRSLERMKTRHWHRVWRDRWRSMQHNPSPARVHFGVLANAGIPHRVDALLRDPQWVSMVLASPPPSEPRPGLDELAAALRSGLPVVIWHPDAPPEDVRRIVDWLTDSDGLVDLPARSHKSRLSEFLPDPAPFNVDVARDLVILWDDPTRIVAFDQPLIPSRQLRNTGDEHQRTPR
ncbi:hypothetical protein [Actinophytocola sp.]|uniref:VMAP-C domain-containing protein n=1 Tax=Actinophytocola sp. TaxID=1872138 RepID=UPI002DDD2A97|nr:hypothetical protein [Actinophytocola sp.]